MNKKTSVAAMVISAIVGFFLVGHLSACNAQPKQFTSQAGSFSVTTPVALKEDVKSTNVPQVGTIAIHIFTGSQGNKGYSVSYNDFPEDFMKQADIEKVLDGGVQGQVSNVNGKLVLATKISLGDSPGREVVIDMKTGDGRDATIKSRIYLVHNRLYQVMVLAPKGEVSNDEMMKYLESFKLI